MCFVRVYACFNEGSFRIDYDGLTFDDRDDFEDYCKEKILEHVDNIDKDNLEDAILTLYIAHSDKIRD